MKKIVFLIIFLLSNCLWESCCDYPDECFEMGAMETGNFSLDGNKELSSGDTVAVNSYAIFLEAETIDKMCALGLQGGNGLFALQCEEPSYILKDQAVSISIVSDADLIEYYGAGIELKGFFKPVELYAACLGQVDTSHYCLRDYSTYYEINSLEDAFNKLMAVNFYLAGKGKIEYERLNLLSLHVQEPVLEHTHNFKVRIQFASGKTLEMETNEVYLQ